VFYLQMMQVIYRALCVCNGEKDRSLVIPNTFNP